MKIYVLVDDYGTCPSDHDYEVLGAFTSKEAADRAAARLTAQEEARKAKLDARARWSDTDHDYRVTEHEDGVLAGEEEPDARPPV